MATNPTGSILVRRGPTTDRLAFCPLQGEIIYDTTLNRFYIGDGITFGGVGINQRDFPNTGVMIKGTTVDSFIVVPGKTASGDSPVQFLSYNKSANAYEFSTITASGIAMTSLTVQGVGDIIATRSDVSPIVIDPTFSTTGTLSLSVNKTTLFASPTFTGTPLSTTATVGTNTTQIATTAFVQTAVSNLVNSAPAALDTLNELAIALGNDANFSATIMTSLGTKAPIASPTFTGTITGTLEGTATGLSQTLAITSGGTGATSASAALTNLLPAGTTSGYVLKTGGPGSFYWSAETGSSSSVGTTINTSRNEFTATSGQTVFTGIGTYTIGAGQLRVYINGVRQFPAAYTETSSTSFTLTSGVLSGTKILAEVDGYINNTVTASTTAFSPTAGVLATNVQAAIAELDSKKAPIASPTFTGTVSGITSTMVGLGNVNNTADSVKSVASATNATNIVSGGTIASNVTATTQTAGTNNTTIATTAFVMASTTAIPSGIITMWSGSIVAIPAGWYLCNGFNGTPDLRDRFVVGAGTTYNIGDTGGTKDAVVVSHSHTATVTDPGHAHTGTIVGSVVGGSGGLEEGASSPNYQFASIATNTTGITVANTTVGVSGTNANLPPYYALAYIMKS